jgi:hypothetical protein
MLKHRSLEESCKASSEKLKEQYQMLVNHSQFTSKRKFQTGSLAEVSLNELTIKKLCPEKLPDCDLMTYSNDHLAFSATQRVPDFYHGFVLRYHTEGMHAGYVRLIIENEQGEMFYSNTRWKQQLGENERTHGPAIQTEVMYYTIDQYSDVNDVEIRDLIEELDDVPAIHNPYWPVEASEWISRKRKSGVPSKSVIKKVVQYGCDFVAVAHKHCTAKDNEWRFSFSMAELIIINNWTMTQRIIYRALRVLCKSCQTAESQLCIYFFKTLMLWACEKKPDEFWITNNYFRIIIDLLLEMINCLHEKYCPNYFIPSNNIMDTIEDNCIIHDINSLWCKTSAQIPVILELCSLEENCSNNFQWQVELPSWILSSLSVLCRIGNLRNTFTNLLSNDCSVSQQNALLSELSHVFQGLKLHQQAARCTTNKRHFVEAAEVYFTEHTDKFKLTGRETVDADWSFDNILYSYFQRSTPFNERNKKRKYNFLRSHVFTLSKNLHSKRSVYSGTDYMKIIRSRDVVKNKSKEDISILLYSKFKSQIMHDYIYLLRTMPTESPTVCISWFITKAYLANLHYTMTRKYITVITLCQEIMTGSKKSKCNSFFAERTLPVILSTEWTEIYDREIQAILGFYSLCSYLLKCNSLVYLGVCPILYILYLMVRYSVHKKGPLVIKPVKMPVHLMNTGRFVSVMPG